MEGICASNSKAKSNLALVYVFGIYDLIVFKVVWLFGAVVSKWPVPRNWPGRKSERMIFEIRG